MRTRLTEEILRQVVYAVVQRHLGSGTPLMPSAIWKVKQEFNSHSFRFYAFCRSLSTIYGWNLFDNFPALSHFKKVYFSK